ncbi:hypothetical protein QL285_026562 [Trifolium repens]|jgi:hypothetical protein|nr:hypothetical protein QL285_026562 [Trifolium repens]
MLQSPFELLLSLKQIGTAEEYREQFELYAGPLKCSEPAYLKHIFLNGLKEVIQAELKLHTVEGLSEMMDYARRIDEKNILINKDSAGNKNHASFTNGASHSSIVGEANSIKIIESFRGKGLGRLSDAENALPPPPKHPDPNSSLVKGKLPSGLIKPTLLMSTNAMVCFWVKNTIQNKVYDPGITSHVSHSALTLYFKLWDPGGGHLFNQSP